MKKIFSMLLVCCTAFAYADDSAPIFEDAPEDVKFAKFAPFTVAEDPVFEQVDEDETGQCKDGECTRPTPKPKEDNTLLPYAYRFFPGQSGDQSRVSYVQWPRFKTHFGMEKIFVRFPQRPAISQSNTLLTAYAYDVGVMYSVSGYFPPIGSINAGVWFDEILFNLDRYPCTLSNHSIFQDSSGVWILDYVAHDYIKDLVIKARAVVTPFNAYTLQCIKPNGSRDYFSYFVENIFIRLDMPQ